MGELKYADDGELTMLASTVQWKEGQQPSQLATAAGGVQQQKRSLDAMLQEAQPTFIQTLLRTDNEGEEEDVGDEESFNEAFCDAIKDDVWTNPVKYYRSWESLANDVPEDDDAP